MVVAEKMKHDCEVLTEMRRSLPVEGMKGRNERLFLRQIKSLNQQLATLEDELVQRSLEPRRSLQPRKKRRIMPTMVYTGYSQQVKAKGNAASEMFGNPYLTTLLLGKLPPAVSNVVIRERILNFRVPVMENVYSIMFWYKAKIYKFDFSSNVVKVTVLSWKLRQTVFFSQEHSMVFTEPNDLDIHKLIRICNFLVNSAVKRSVWNSPYSNIIEIPEKRKYPKCPQIYAYRLEVGKLMREVKDKIPVGVLTSENFFLFSSESSIELTNLIGFILLSVKGSAVFVSGMINEYGRDRLFSLLREIVKGNFTVGPFYHIEKIQTDGVEDSNQANHRVIQIPGELEGSPWPHGFRAILEKNNRLVDA